MQARVHLQSELKHGTQCTTNSGKARTGKGTHRAASAESREREDTKRRKAEQGPAPAGVDPDIADITPGPQPLADWQLEE